jgi:zinc protease
MNRLHRAVATAALVAAAGTAPEAKTMERIFPYDAHVETLDNGMGVILVPMSSEGLVAYWTIVRTGSRDEYEPGRTGFAHFFEHMMFQGTENVDQAAYNAALTRMGADANAFTSTDLTAYHIGVTSDDLEEVMRLESDRFQHLAYAESDFETEAGAVYGEYRKNRMNPFFTVWEAVHQAAFDRHTYGHTTMGYEADIKEMPKMFDYSRSFFERYYRPDNVVLLIAGDVEVDRTMALVRKYYGAWQRGYTAPAVPEEPPQTTERRIDVEYQGKTLPIVWLAYKARKFDPSDETWAASAVLAELAFGETSDVYKKLVLEEQAVELITADASVSRDPGLLSIYARVKDPARVDHVLSEIDAVVARYRERPPDPARLADLKSRLKYEFLMGLDTPDGVASGLARIVAVTGGIGAVDDLYATYARIEPEDVQAAAREILVPTGRTVAVLREAKP